MANEIARKLRRTMTRQEVKLWVHLRQLKPFGFHFRRQVPIRNFIVDFACYHPRVVVELDGSQHAQERHSADDARRDAILTAEGFRVVRVWNNEIDRNLDGVFDQILHELHR